MLHLGFGVALGAARACRVTPPLRRRHGTKVKNLGSGGHGVTLVAGVILEGFVHLAGDPALEKEQGELASES